MKNYGIQKGSTEPKELEIIGNSIFVASDIKPFEEQIDDYIIRGYEYNYTEYTKDEYIMLLSNQTNELKDELTAAKILLGVE